MQSVTCPCCGYKTLYDRGEYNICIICYWEDDPFQREDVDYISGANRISLREAQKNYAEFGVSEHEMKKYVVKAGKNDLRDPDWKPLS